jgi:hypothetical protein
MARHRPLSAWVARVMPGTSTLGPINDGDERADARHLDLFLDEWQRAALSWRGDPACGLVRTADGLGVVELDQHGQPIVVEPGAVETIRRIERDWPRVDGQLEQLRDAPLALRYWLLERLDEEGEPPDEAFGILPWDLLDRCADAIASMLRPGGAMLAPVEIRYWLTPAVRGVSGPLEQLDEGLRTGDGATADQGAITLLTNLRDLPLVRIPEPSRRRLAEVARMLGRAYPRHHDLARQVTHRLEGGADPVPDDLSALAFAALTPAAYLSENGPRAATRGVLDFDEAGPFGEHVVGRVSRQGGELHVVVTGFSDDLPELSVGPDEPDAPMVPMTIDGQALRARIAWTRLDLPARLVFRMVRR